MERPETLAVLPVLHTGLKIPGRPPIELEIPISPERFTAGSSCSNLQRSLFPLLVVGFVDSLAGPKVVLQPCLIASLLKPSRLEPYVTFPPQEIHIDDIDSFDLVRLEPVPEPSDLAALAKIPEVKVKESLAEILKIDPVPKDWGGETCDLYTSDIRVHGERISAAFLLKGPAKFSIMRMGHLGTNHDQLDRLKETPAQLLILQHCHEVGPDVRNHLALVANQIGRPRRYCVINGSDTLRVLRAYSKCGQTPTPRSSIRGLVPSADRLR